MTFPDERRALRRKRDKEERAEFYENEKMQDFVLKNIHDVVVELFERNNEVPFIACYRKEVRTQALHFVFGDYAQT